MNYIDGIAHFIVAFFAIIAVEILVIGLTREVFLLYRWKGIGVMFLAILFFASYIYINEA